MVLQEMRSRIERNIAPLSKVPSLQMVLIDTDGRSLNSLIHEHKIGEAMDVAALPLRAQLPVNPLRSAATMPRAAVSAERDVFAEVEPTPIRTVVATEDLPPADPPSVVPQQFGAPPDPYAGPQYGYLPAEPEQHR